MAKFYANKLVSPHLDQRKISKEKTIAIREIRTANHSDPTTATIYCAKASGQDSVSASRSSRSRTSCRSKGTTTETMGESGL